MVDKDQDGLWEHSFVRDGYRTSEEVLADERRFVMLNLSYNARMHIKLCLFVCLFTYA